MAKLVGTYLYQINDRGWTGLYQSNTHYDEYKIKKWWKEWEENHSDSDFEDYIKSIGINFERVFVENIDI